MPETVQPGVNVPVDVYGEYKQLCHSVTRLDYEEVDYGCGSGSCPGGGHALRLQLARIPSGPMQKQCLGEALYPKIEAREPHLVGKITGMLLEMSIEELIEL